MSAAEATKKYAQSEKGKAVRRKMRQSTQYKEMQKRWREGGGSAAEYQRNKDKYRDSYMKRVYGISLNEYNEMIEVQQNKCFVCRNSPGVKSLAVDHCHTSGKVRKLLCHKCNTALGNVDEDITILKKLIDYLELHK